MVLTKNDQISYYNDYKYSSVTRINSKYKIFILLIIINKLSEIGTYCDIKIIIRSVYI